MSRFAARTALAAAALATLATTLLAATACRVSVHATAPTARLSVSTPAPIGARTDVLPVPDLRGLSLADAVTAVRRAGFQHDAYQDEDIAGVNASRCGAAELRGRVCAQDPEPGGTAMRAGTVRVMIGGAE